MRWALGQGIRKVQSWKSMWRVGECVWHSCQKMQGDAKNTRTSGPHLHTWWCQEHQDTKSSSTSLTIVFLHPKKQEDTKNARTSGPIPRPHIVLSNPRRPRYLLLYCAFRLSLQILLYWLNVAKMMKMKPLTIIVAMLLCIFVSGPQAAQWVSLTSSQL